MSITKTRTIINAIELQRAQPGGFVFNDKLADGSRSIKVWGWTAADYSKAADALREAGFKVEVKERKSVSRGVSYTVTRLHVTE